MTVRLRIVLDQVVSPSDPDLADASENLASALVVAAPSGCDVAGILPASIPDAPPIPTLAALADTWRAPLQGGALAQAWRRGIPLGGAGGMIHSPTLLAPLVRHDRVHDHDQTVVTLWSLEAWRRPGRLARRTVAWHRAMLARAVRYADAVVVPTHAMAAELSEIAALGARIRVIAGAPRDGFGVPDDAAARLRVMGAPDRYILALGDATHLDEVGPAVRVAAELDLDIVVLRSRPDGGDGAEPPLAERVRDAGLSDIRIREILPATTADRAALLSGALAVVEASGTHSYPWRLLEALAVGAPIVATASAQVEEVLVDAAEFVPVDDGDALTDAVRRVVEHEAVARRLRVLSADRARAFSWRDAADRVWQLHAEL